MACGPAGGRLRKTAAAEKSRSWDKGRFFAYIDSKEMKWRCSMWSLISPSELEQYLDERRPMVLVDLRDRASYQAGHIRGAVNIPYEEMAAQLYQLPPNVLVVLYCYHGPRSMLMARYLSDQGFTVADVYGGIDSYRGKYMEYP